MAHGSKHAKADSASGAQMIKNVYHGDNPKNSTSPAQQTRKARQQYSQRVKNPKVYQSAAEMPHAGSDTQNYQFNQPSSQQPGHFK